MNEKSNHFSSLCWLAIHSIRKELRINNNGYCFDMETLSFFNDEIDFYINTETLI
jgi:hypothetical protein